MAVALIAGLAVGAAPAGAWTGGGGASGGPLLDGAPQPDIDEPPPPVISSGGRRLSAVLGSFCYRGACGDVGSDGPKSARALPVRRGALVTIRFRIAIRRAVLVKFPCCATYARLRRHDRAGRLWSFRAPATPVAPVDLVIGVDFPIPGDAEWGFKLGPPGRR